MSKHEDEMEERVKGSAKEIETERVEMEQLNFFKCGRSNLQVCNF
jgi:hypothetical protein